MSSRGPGRAIVGSATRGAAVGLSALVLTAVASVVSDSSAEALPAEDAQPVPVTVLTRNIYLGADIAEALRRLPDLPAASQFMWEQVRATDFAARAPLLAAEAAEARPAVIGLQEATTWNCRPGLFSATTVVYDFTQDLINATEEAGVPYLVASADDAEAVNPGYSIGPLPRLSTVRDPEVFQPLFGTDTAACGFQISDVLLVRADLAPQVRATGITEFDDAYALVPWLMEIQRGYAWADIEIEGALVRFVSTHLESIWDEDAQNLGPEQARQIVGDLGPTELPLVVLGDFNNDPRDPRPRGADNPGGQPEAGAICQAQVDAPDVDSALDQCNAYWVMVKGGYTDAGPDAQEPANFTWGSDALLAGPDAQRHPMAIEMGNEYGWTDRLDYVFVKNGVTVQGAQVIGNVWPASSGVWSCDDPQQVQNTSKAAGVRAQAGRSDAVPVGGVCLASDHAGVVAQLLVTPPSAEVVAASLGTAPDPNDSWLNRQMVALAALGAVIVALLLLLVGAVIWVLRVIVRSGRPRDADREA